MKPMCELLERTLKGVPRTHCCGWHAPRWRGRPNGLGYLNTGDCRGRLGSLAMTAFSEVLGKLAVCWVLFLAIGLVTQAAFAAGPYQATGFKVGEVTDTSAIVWTRLTRNAERVSDESPMPKVFYRNSRTGKLEERGKGRKDTTPVIKYPEGVTIDSIEGACPGADGEVRVHYLVSSAGAWMSTDWFAVDSGRDFTHQFLLAGLAPNARYKVRVEARAMGAEEASCTLKGGFRTAPAPDAPARVVFAVSTGQAYNDHDLPEGYKIYGRMLELDPNFFVHTGDIVYYDSLAKNIALARWHWARTYSFPTNVAFHNRVSSYFIKDDHDTWVNDCWPSMKTRFMGDFTFEQGLAVFPEQVPMGEKTYRTVRWGKDLQVWLVEGRDYRSPNTMKDGPEKTIWGEEQKAWFKRTVQASDAAFRVLISPTPVVGPDRDNKRDNHSNAVFAHEGRELREFIAGQKNMVVVCGDRHWQYISVDKDTGVREYSCGPASDEHAGGWTQEDRRPEHQYLNVTGGFLAVTVERIDGKPAMTCRFYSVDGDVLNEDRLVAE